MDIKHHTHPDQLEKYSFLWSEARLLLAAIALFAGGVPAVYVVAPALGVFPIVRTLLTLGWIISDATSVYLLYRWNAKGRKVFGGDEKKDVAAFWVMIISGVNLGFAGLSGVNIGFSITSARLILIIVAFAYLASAWHLHKRWKSSGEKLFI